MKLLPFDIEKAKAGAKVVNRDEEHIRLVCFEGDDPVYPLVDSRGGLYKRNGLYNLHGESSNDLFLLSEPTYREWQGIDEVPLNLILRHKNSGFIYYPVGMCEKPLRLLIKCFGGLGLDASSLFKEYEHTTDNGKTWLPCGVLQ